MKEPLYDLYGNSITFISQEIILKDLLNKSEAEENIMIGLLGVSISFNTATILTIVFSQVYNMSLKKLWEAIDYV